MRVGWGLRHNFLFTRLVSALSFGRNLLCFPSLYRLEKTHFFSHLFKSTVMNSKICFRLPPSYHFIDIITDDKLAKQNTLDCGRLSFESIFQLKHLHGSNYWSVSELTVQFTQGESELKAGLTKLHWIVWEQNQGILQIVLCSQHRNTMELLLEYLIDWVYSLALRFTNE